MFKKIILAVAMMLPMFGAQAQTLKIGLVDTNVIVQAHPDTQEAQKKLEDASKKYEEEYQKLGVEMQRMYGELKDDDLPAIKERKTKELQDYAAKIQAFEQNAQQDLNRMQQELMSPVIQKIRDAVDSVAKEEGFSLIQEISQQMYYTAPVEDITAKVKAKLGLK